jgi:methyl-branched lipid omega-hydroxylase
MPHPGCMVRQAVPRHETEPHRRLTAASPGEGRACPVGQPGAVSPWEPNEVLDPEGGHMTSPQPAPIVGDLDLSQNEFWGQPPAQRYAAFAQLRAMQPPPFFEAPENPFGTPERGYYALLRHPDVVEASRTPEVFSSAAGATSAIDLPVEFNEYFGSMINMDDPRHARLRRIVSRAFTPRMIKKFEEDVQRTATGIVDDLLVTGPCDFVQHVSARLPLKIICDMMGIGDEHFGMVLKNTNIILSGADPEFISQDMNEAVTQLLTAGQDLAALVTGLAEQRQAEPADDLVSALATANIDGEQLTPAELASFFILLVVAGNETTRTAISHSLALLTEHRDQRELLLADFEDRIGPAVEEIVRYVSPVIWMRRTVTRDTVMNGHAYREGDKALLVYQAANRDETIFRDPDRFDVTRTPNPHVGFGSAGPHFCLGAHLARREITAILRELLTRVPDIRAAGEPDRLLSSFINGIKHLPCEFA